MPMELLTYRQSDGTDNCMVCTHDQAVNKEMNKHVASVIVWCGCFAFVQQEWLKTKGCVNLHVIHSIIDGQFESWFDN